MSIGEERRQRREGIVRRLYNEGWAAGKLDLMMHGVVFEESIEAGDRLVCVQRGAATGKGSGVRSEIHYACVYTFGAGERIVEVNEYATREEALAAAQMEP